MNETYKCRETRERYGDFDRYLNGNGLDIGAGPDVLVVPNGQVRAWDKGDGDAQYLATLDDDSFDFVYSSHCLEHVVDVRVALKNWARVCRKTGFLYVVVPEWTLYEHRHWPSLHNPEHRTSFSMIACESPNHPHYDMEALVKLGAECGLRLVAARLDMDGFNFALHRTEPPIIDQTMHGALAQMTLIWRKL